MVQLVLNGQLQQTINDTLQTGKPTLDQRQLILTATLLATCQHQTL